MITLRRICQWEEVAMVDLSTIAMLKLTEVRDETGAVLEKYEYDRAGNVLAKTVKGETTTYAYDAANQLVTATDSKGVVTQYAYDAAGRMVKEGEKTYKYGYLDKVLSVTEGSDKYTYDYHVDGQLATATYGNTTEDFLWDGLALVKRGKRGFVNEPHVGGGNPVLSSDGTTYFNDMLGTTLSSSANGETTASSLTAFGAETHNSQLTTHNSASDSFFTGKPFVPGLGHAFLFRNYRSDLGKWQTADPLGYPDGWNQLTYCGNGVTSAVDLWGCDTEDVLSVTVANFHLGDVWVWCNHDYDHPGAMLRYWTKEGVTYDRSGTRTDEKGIVHYYSFDKKIVDHHLNIEPSDPWNKVVEVSVTVKVTIEDSWTEVTTDKDGNVIASIERFINTEETLTGTARHFIPKITSVPE